MTALPYNSHMPEFTPQDFVSKWKRLTARKKQIYQEHFIDLYRLIGHYLNDGEILEKLLSLNLERE